MNLRQFWIAFSNLRWIFFRISAFFKFKKTKPINNLFHLKQIKTLRAQHHRNLLLFSTVPKIRKYESAPALLDQSPTRVGVVFPKNS